MTEWWCCTPESTVFSLETGSPAGCGCWLSAPLRQCNTPHSSSPAGSLWAAQASPDEKARKLMERFPGFRGTPRAFIRLWWVTTHLAPWWNTEAIQFEKATRVCLTSEIISFTSIRGSHSSEETLRDWKCLSLTWWRLSRTRTLAPKISQVLHRPTIQKPANECVICACMTSSLAKNAVHL